MKVLKFGGSSVANAENIKKVIEIVGREKDGDQLVVVASALGKVTDQLEESGKMASLGDERYKQILKNIESIHLAIIDSLFPLKNQSEIKAGIKMMMNELEDICLGIFLLQEINTKIYDLLLSFGERLSGQVLSKALNFYGVRIRLLDAREIILTDETFGHAQVKF